MQVCAVFYSRVIRKSVSPKFIELCMETSCFCFNFKLLIGIITTNTTYNDRVTITPCWCPSEGHQHGGRTITELSAMEFFYLNETLLV